MAKSSVKEFLKRENVDITVQAYLIDALRVMVFGLFASLLISTIFGTLGQQLQIRIFNVIAGYTKSATGVALGITITHALEAPQLVLFSAATVGIAGDALGDPVGALVATIMAVELGEIISKETRLNIIVTPGITVISGVLVTQSAGPDMAGFMNWFGNLVKAATEMQPSIMGILVSALIGIALTLPISSTAICIALSLDGLAGGAAITGRCAQMIGFAVMGYHENKVGGLMVQGLGVSTLQVDNIVLNLRIWILPTLASMITDPIVTMVFRLENIPAGSGMGTYGLIGPVGIYTTMSGRTSMWVGILLVCFLLPAVPTLVFGEIPRRMGWMKDRDLKSDLQGGRHVDGGFESKRGVEDGRGGLAHGSLRNNL